MSLLARSIADLISPPPSELIRIYGVVPAAQPWSILQLALHLRRPLVVIAPSLDQLDELSAGIESFLSTQPASVDSPKLILLPTWEQSPFSPISPAITIRHARISALHRLYLANQSHTPFILITTLQALSQTTLPKKALEGSSFQLAVNSSLGSRETFIQRLISAGYQQTETLEDPGYFSIRGELIDLFPPGYDEPLRIELFDDLIEKIRFFNPSTQRSSQTPFLPEQGNIPPAREFLITHENKSLIREKIKHYADEQGIPRSIRDPLLASVDPGYYHERSDTWIPFAYAEPASALSYLSQETLLVWQNHEDSLSIWKKSLEELEEERKNSLTAGSAITPSQALLFGTPETTGESLRRYSQITFDSLEVVTTVHQKNFRAQTNELGSSQKTLDDLLPRIRDWINTKYKIIIFCQTQTQKERLQYLLKERDLSFGQEGSLQLFVGQCAGGFILHTEGIVVLPDALFFGAKNKRSLRRTSSSSRSWSGLQTLSDLSPGDLIVHIDHGIGKYLGLTRLTFDGAESDFLTIEYAGNDKLYLPVYKLDAVQKYFGSEASTPLDKLGSGGFAKAKTKAQEAVRTLAVDLLKIYAARATQSGFAYPGRDSSYREFETKFPYDETPDQMKAIDDVLADLESGKIMDRLVCGDVGFGKTEVAMRAAFQVISGGKQVVVLVPTTILTLQHETSFRSRFKDYPIQIESLSRFKSPSQQKDVLSRTRSGGVDVLIGTHRLLSKDLDFKDLGLIIVDEEQRFGVEQKEKLKGYRTSTPVLTLSATPIPRTLHMALSSLRDISLMNTPPVDRVPTKTYVSRFDEDLIKRAMHFEISRGGQVFFLHNRVQTIYETSKLIESLVPEMKVIVAHGQMKESELERVMLDFYEKRAQILVCTAIIESGLDIPSANTIIIDRADTFGLAQLYQLRGRIGRGQHRGYAYLLLPAEGEITNDAKKRLEIIQRFVELGSGFNIASHDLELRGGGDLLGPNQSGLVSSIGFELYTELLEDAIREARGDSPVDSSRHKEPEIKVPFSSFLSETYVPDIHQRLSLYRRLSGSQNESELLQLEEELVDRFGPLPEEAKNLLALIRIKQTLKDYGMDALTVGPDRFVVTPGSQSRLDPARAISYITTHSKKAQLTRDSKIILRVAVDSPQKLSLSLEELLEQLVAKA